MPLDRLLLGRRRFLGWSGTVAGGIVLGVSALLAACGSDDADPFVLVKRWDDTANGTGTVRLPLALASPKDMSLLATGPASLTGRVVDANGAQVTTFTAPRHDQDISIPYWPIQLQLAQAGIYTVFVDGGDENGVAVQVFDPADVATPVHGRALPAFDTPTVDDPRGVNPVCTLSLIHI